MSIITIPQDIPIEEGECTGDHPGYIYLLHFEKPFHHARHYIGWASCIDSRMIKHENGTGSKLVKAVMEAGIKVNVARIWAGDRNFERKLHKRHCSPRLCPCCKGDKS